VKDSVIILRLRGINIASREKERGSHAEKSDTELA
jgi:broad-specificity NMP kinase